MSGQTLYQVFRKFSIGNGVKVADWNDLAPASRATWNDLAYWVTNSKDEPL